MHKNQKNFVRETPKRIEKFDEIAKYVNATVEKKIDLDCKTRWNSTYIILLVLHYHTMLFS
jgi:hypothetical protein